MKLQARAALSIIESTTGKRTVVFARRQLRGANNVYEGTVVGLLVFICGRFISKSRKRYQGCDILLLVMAFYFRHNPRCKAGPRDICWLLRLLPPFSTCGILEVIRMDHDLTEAVLCEGLGKIHMSATKYLGYSFTWYRRVSRDDCHSF